MKAIGALLIGLLSLSLVVTVNVNVEPVVKGIESTLGVRIIELTKLSAVTEPVLVSRLSTPLKVGLFDAFKSISLSIKAST